MKRTTTVGLRELKNRLSRFVTRVRRGEEYVVTIRGAAVARLVPVGGERSIEDLIAEGLVERAPRPRREITPRIRSSRRGPRTSLGATVVADRR
jgi:prevent-host-death family protein